MLKLGSIVRDKIPIFSGHIGYIYKILYYGKEPNVVQLYKVKFFDKYNIIGSSLFSENEIELIS